MIVSRVLLDICFLSTPIHIHIHVHVLGSKVAVVEVGIVKVDLGGLLVIETVWIWIRICIIPL